MARSLLLRLERDRDFSVLDRRLDLFATLAHDDHPLVRAQCVDPLEQVKQQRPAGDRMQHFVRVGTHARALPRGKDDNGETALVAHRGASHGMARKPAPVARI